MRSERRIDPCFEVIVCAPAESFRWDQHDYPIHLAKWHYHPEYELHLITQSSGMMMIGDYVGPFEAGNLILTGPNVPHNWVSDIGPNERIAGRDMLIQFGEDLAENVVGMCPEFAEIETMLEESSCGVEFVGLTAQAGRRLLHQIGSARGAQRMLLFIELLVTLSRFPGDRRTLSRRVPVPNGANPSSGKLEAAMDYILAHVAEPMRLGDVAAACGMEPAAFSRFFKRQTGHTFARYVNRLRIYRACTLLTQTDASVTDICFEVGFNNVANFNRQFAKICGQPPSLYRRNARHVGFAVAPPSMPVLHA
jgi:AraC-like DNA-binding protein